MAGQRQDKDCHGVTEKPSTERNKEIKKKGKKNSTEAAYTEFTKRAGAPQLRYLPFVSVFPCGFTGFGRISYNRLRESAAPRRKLCLSGHHFMNERWRCAKA